MPLGTLQDILQAFGKRVQVVGKVHKLNWWQVARLDLELEAPKGRYSVHLQLKQKAGWSVNGCRDMVWRAGIYQSAMSEVAG